MTRIPPLDREQAPPESQALWDAQIAAHGRMTNMKKTLARSPLALRVLMEWYPLRAETAAFLGDRATLLFAHSVSSATDCLICSTFFRRILMDAGEDPANLAMDERERTVTEFGRKIAAGGHGVSDDLYSRLLQYMTPDQFVTLTAFGGIMLATNVFNNAAGVELDEYLWPYRAPGKEARA